MKVAAEDIPYLRKTDITEKDLRIFQAYCCLNIQDRQRLLEWQLKHKVKWDILENLAYMTANKMMRYLEKQNSFLYARKNKYGFIRYKDMPVSYTHLDVYKRQVYPGGPARGDE